MLPEPCGVWGRTGRAVKEPTRALGRQKCALSAARAGGQDAGRPRAGCGPGLWGGGRRPGNLCVPRSVESCAAVPGPWGPVAGVTSGLRVSSSGPCDPPEVRPALAGEAPAERGEGLGAAPAWAAVPVALRFQRVAQVPPGRRTPTPVRDLPSRGEDARSGPGQHPAPPRVPRRRDKWRARRGRRAARTSSAKEGRTRLGKVAFPRGRVPRRSPVPPLRLPYPLPQECPD